jgi:L,D-transpeptidase catalytic domain
VSPGRAQARRNSRVEADSLPNALPRVLGRNDMNAMIDSSARNAPAIAVARTIAAICAGLCAMALLGALSAGPAWARAVDRSAPRDPGIRFELDRETYRVHVVDLASGEAGPEIPVAIGSPAHPSPHGEYRVWQVVHDPAWNPGRTARSLGARRVAPSPDGPLGIAKIPIAGEYALHGGASWLTVGKPVTLGCLRATDDSIRNLIDWLELHGALARMPSARSGERPQAFARPARFVIR